MTETSVRTATSLLRFRLKEPEADSAAPLLGGSGPPRPFQISELAAELNGVSDLLSFAGYLVLVEHGEEFGYNISSDEELDNLAMAATMLTQEGFAVRRFTYASDPDLWLYLGGGGGATAAGLSLIAARNYIITTADKVIDLWEKFSRVRADAVARRVQVEDDKTTIDELRRVRKGRATGNTRAVRMATYAQLALESAVDVTMEPEEELPNP